MRAIGSLHWSLVCEHKFGGMTDIGRNAANFVPWLLLFLAFPKVSGAEPSPSGGLFVEPIAQENKMQKLPQQLFSSAEVYYLRGLCAQSVSNFKLAQIEFQLAQKTDDRQLIGKAQAGFYYSRDRQSKISDEEIIFASRSETLPPFEEQP
jgi:hypothetical protein